MVFELILDAASNELTPFQKRQFLLPRLTATALIFLGKNPACLRNLAG